MSPVLVLTLALLSSGLIVHNFVDFERNDKLLHLKNDQDRRAGDKIKDNETYLNNFTIHSRWCM